ncbi:hypothetical protein [Reyranella sp.]|uniref:hypothetical protein n=1 Tax=Reyranella sp. TaxID=1929291 RepID=UPI00272FEF99|nr:hypothetical protein [Reyranella sp.]MDP2375199.1 hypothetical protein [Reyranella sp.]
MKSPALGWQLVLAFVVSLLVLVGLIGWLQNVHILTANGMYKAIQTEPWIANPATARLDDSNYLYFPLYGALCRLLDWLGIERGVPWKQLAYINAFWASLCIVFVYAFVHRVTRSARAAVLAAVFHFGCGFFLLLAVISEDIMPGYTLVFGAMALAGLWFDRPTYARVAVVGSIFTLGWLMEWRLIFPTLPALVLTLALSNGTIAWRLRRIVMLIAAILATAGIVQLLWDGHNGAVGLHDMLWTGKGVASGWAGLSWDKAWMMLSGVGNYFLIMGGFTDPVTARHLMFPLSVSVLLQAAIFVAAVVALWPQRADRRLRAIAIVFLGTLGAGEVFNFYAQPQDPQMQINVMPWLTVAWGLLAAKLVMKSSRPRALLFLAILSLAPLIWNGAQLARWRDGDRASLAALAAIEKRFPPDSTVFLYWGFEPITVWQYALWSRTWDWDGAATVAPAPSATPKFKWIAIAAGAIRHPDWTVEQHEKSIKRDIDQALDRGYRVVVSDVWNWSVDQLAGQLGGVAAASRAPAIYRMLHDNFEARQVFSDPAAGTYYELRRR